MTLSSEEAQRYSRHLLLNEVGESGQVRLKEARVAIVGAGGLGSPVLMYLAAAGVGTIGIFDYDTVDRSNLQRQVLYGESDIDRKKVDAASARLRDLNPNVQVVTHIDGLNSENALELLSLYDIVVDGTDNFPTRYLLNDACVILGKPLVYGSIYRFEGQVSVFNHKGGPTYRDLFPSPPAPNSVPSCAEAGVLGVLPAVVGSIQANEVIKLILDVGKTLSGRLLLYNALDMTFDELTLKRVSERAEITELIDYHGFCGLRSVMEETLIDGQIMAIDCNDRLKSGWKPFILDVRNPAELLVSRFPNCDANVPLPSLIERTASLPKDRQILLICKLGKRASHAQKILTSLGFENPVVLLGGINGWSNDIDPSIPTY